MGASQQVAKRVMEVIRPDAPYPESGYRNTVGIGVLDRHRMERLVGGLVLFSPRDRSVEAGMASFHDGVADSGISSWLSPGVVKGFYFMVFEQLHYLHLRAEVNHDNRRSIAVLQRIGFTMEGRRRACREGGGDVLMWGMTLAEYERWRDRPDELRFRK